MLFDALTLGLGYNATLVTLGAALLGAAGGFTGTFLFLRKRALVTDATAHSTLPGVGIAFIVLVALGGDGRSLPGLMLGSAIAAALGLMMVQWLSRSTRLSEDAAIGAVLSTFFGFGIVLLTIIQTMTAGRQAGLEGFLLGSTAGMLMSDAIVIATGGAIIVLLVILLARPMIAVAFDPEYAASRGVPVGAVDFAAMGLALAVTVIGLKIVGLIMIVALLIIPPAAARFWTERAGVLAVLAGLIGGVAAWTGAAISATAPALPTGPIIVLTTFAVFLVSLIVAPDRGILAAIVRYRRFQAQVHVRQGLLALAQGQPIFERLTLRLLRRKGFVRPDGVATDDGRARAAKALLDERRWQVARAISLHEAASRYDGVSDIETVLTPDQISDLDGRITGPEVAT